MAWRACARPLDPGEAMQVLDVLAPQHLQQRLRRHRAERGAVLVDHCERVHAAVQSERGGRLLVGADGDARPAWVHQHSKPLVDGRQDEARQRRRALELSACADDQHQLGAGRPFGGEAREHLARRFLRAGMEHRALDVRGYGFGVPRAAHAPMLGGTAGAAFDPRQ